MKNPFNGAMPPKEARKIVGITKAKYEFIVAGVGLDPTQGLSDLELVAVRLIYLCGWGWGWGEDPTKEYMHNIFNSIKAIDWSHMGSPSCKIGIRNPDSLTGVAIEPLLSNQI